MRLRRGTARPRAEPQTPPAGRSAGPGPRARAKGGDSFGQQTSLEIWKMTATCAPILADVSSQSRLRGHRVLGCKIGLLAGAAIYVACGCEWNFWTGGEFFRRAYSMERTMPAATQPSVDLRRPGPARSVTNSGATCESGGAEPGRTQSSIRGKMMELGLKRTAFGTVADRPQPDAGVFGTHGG